LTVDDVIWYIGFEGGFFQNRLFSFNKQTIVPIGTMVCLLEEK